MCKWIQVRQRALEVAFCVSLVNLICPGTAQPSQDQAIQQHSPGERGVEPTVIFYGSLNAETMRDNVDAIDSDGISQVVMALMGQSEKPLEPDELKAQLLNVLDSVDSMEAMVVRVQDQYALVVHVHFDGNHEEGFSDLWDDISDEDKNLIKSAVSQFESVFPGMISEFDASKNSWSVRSSVLDDSFDFRKAVSHFRQSRDLERSRRSLEISNTPNDSKLVGNWFINLRELTGRRNSIGDESGFESFIFAAGRVLKRPGQIRIESFVAVTEPRHGAAELLQLNGIDFNIPDWVPTQTMTTLALKFDSHLLANRLAEVDDKLLTKLPIFDAAQSFRHGVKKEHDVEIFDIFGENCTGRIMALHITTRTPAVNCQTPVYAIECRSAQDASQAVGRFAAAKHESGRGFKIETSIGGHLRYRNKWSISSVMTPHKHDNMLALPRGVNLPVWYFRMNVCAIGKWIIVAAHDEPVDAILESANRAENRLNEQPRFVDDSWFVASGEERPCGVLRFDVSEFGRALRYVLDRGESRKLFGMLPKTGLHGLDDINSAVQGDRFTDIQVDQIKRSNLEILVTLFDEGSGFRIVIDSGSAQE